MKWFKMPKNIEDIGIEQQYAFMVFEMMYFANAKTGLCSFNATSLRTKYACRLGTYRRITACLQTANILRTGKKKGVYYCNFNWDAPPTNCDQTTISPPTSCDLDATLTVDKNRVDIDIDNKNINIHQNSFDVCDSEMENSSQLEKPEEKVILDFEALYKKYPRKMGKSKGIALCKTQIKSLKKYNQLEQAIKNYIAYLEKEKKPKEYMKHFNTFMGCWRDFLEIEKEQESEFALFKMRDEL